MLRLCDQFSKNAVHLNSHKCAFCVLVSFRVRSSKEAWQDQSPREHKSVLCVLGIEKQPMSSPVWKFFSVAEEDNAIAICNACSARILRGGKKASSFNTTNLISHLKGRHRGEAVLKG